MPPREDVGQPVPSSARLLVNRNKQSLLESLSRAQRPLTIKENMTKELEHTLNAGEGLEGGRGGGGGGGGDGGMCVLNDLFYELRAASCG